MNNNTITQAYAPASIGNVSLGFDMLGAALAPIDNSQLGDSVSVSFTENATQDSLTVSGPFAHKLPADPKANIVMQCLQHFRQACADVNIDVPSLTMTLAKNLPIGSGLGSSASSIVAAFSALNAHLDNPFNEDALLTMMGECEGQISGSIHYDNVAPSFLGGITLTTGLASPVAQKLPSFDNWYWTVCYSGITVSTAEARKILPNDYSKATTLTFGQQLAVFIDALHRNDPQQAAAVMRDVIAEPYRQSLLPKFSQAREFCMSNGALAFGISGSGPTVFAVSENADMAQKQAEWLSQHYVQNEMGFSHVCRIPTGGIKVTTTQI